MTSLEALPARAAAARPAAGGRWSVSAAASIDDVSRAWLSLEMAGVGTPYQTLGWQRAAASALESGRTPCIVTLKDRRGRTAALIPLVLERRAGVTIAMFAGGKHANYNMGLFTEEAAAITADDLQEALRAAAGAAGIDLFALRSQPALWRGRPNPLALLPHQPSSSSAWRADLASDSEAFIAGIMSSESRKKLRHKERKLAEFGPISYAEAVTPDEARGVLDAFLAQKKARFSALGIANPFEDAAALAFLDRAAVAPLADGPPAPVSLFAMLAGERILAVFGGVIHAGRFSGMFTSFDGDPQVARFSPGDLLLLNLVKTMCARGLKEFDLGAGDAAYKGDYCPIEEKLFDSFLPMTLKGRAAAAGLAAAQRGKRFLKAQKAFAGPLLKLLKR